MTYAILFIGLLLVLGHIFSSLFEKTRLPDVLPLMVLGMLMGPVLHLVDPQSFGQAGEIFTTLALIVVLFKSGLEFRILSLRGAVGQGLLLTTVCFALVTLVIAFLAQELLKVPQIYALIIGVIVADNSTAIISPLLAKLQVYQNFQNHFVFGGQFNGGLLHCACDCAIVGGFARGNINCGYLGVRCYQIFCYRYCFCVGGRSVLDEYFKPRAPIGKCHFAYICVCSFSV